jgi:hypothetical protein
LPVVLALGVVATAALAYPAGASPALAGPAQALLALAELVGSLRLEGSRGPLR